MTHNEQRLIRMDYIHRSVQNCTRNYIDCDKDKLIAVVMGEYGLSKRMTMEYIQALIGQGLIKDEDGKLWATPKSESALKKEMDKVLKAKVKGGEEDGN